jgi:hypothetical protein
MRRFAGAALGAGFAISALVPLTILAGVRGRRGRPGRRAAERQRRGDPVADAETVAVGEATDRAADTTTDPAGDPARAAGADPGHAATVRELPVAARPHAPGQRAVGAAGIGLQQCTSTSGSRSRWLTRAALGGASLALLAAGCSSHSTADSPSAPSSPSVASSPAASSRAPSGPATRITAYPVRVGTYRLVDKADERAAATTKDLKFPKSFSFAATAQDGYYLPGQAKHQIVYPDRRAARPGLLRPGGAPDDRARRAAGRHGQVLGSRGDHVLHVGRQRHLRRLRLPAAARPRHRPHPPSGWRGAPVPQGHGAAQA